MELARLIGHTAQVTAVAVCAGGTRAVSGSADCTLRTWDLEYARKLQVLAGHTGTVTSVAVTPDGARAVSASADATLRVWDLATGAELRTLAGHQRGVTGVALAGRRIVSASDDRTLRVWDLDTGAPLHTLTGHTLWVNTVAACPRRNWAVSGSHDNTLRLWDLDTGRELRTLCGHTGPVTALALRPDGARAVSASQDRTLRLWDLERGVEIELLARLEVPIRAVALTPDGARVVTVDAHGEVTVWGDEPAITHHAAGLTALAVYAGGTRAVIAANDFMLHVWDLERPTEAVPPSHHAAIHSIALFLDGARAISASSDGCARIWDTANEVEIWRSCGARILRAAAARKGTRIVTVDRRHRCELWDGITGQFLGSLGELRGLAALAISANGNHAIAACFDDTVRTWDLATGEQRTIQCRAYRVALNEDGTLACAATTRIRAWHTQTGAELPMPAGDGRQIYSLVFAGEQIAAGFDNGTVQVWDMKSGVMRHQFAADTGGVVALTLFEDPPVAVTASHAARPDEDAPVATWRPGQEEGGSIRRWDLRTGALLREDRTQGEPTACQAVPGVIVAGDETGRVYFLK